MQADDTLSTFAWVNDERTKAVLCLSPSKDLEWRKPYKYIATGPSESDCEDDYYSIATHSPSWRECFRSTLNFPDALPAEIKYQDDEGGPISLKIVQFKKRGYAWALRLKNGRPADTDFSQWSREGQILWKKTSPIDSTWEIWDSRVTEVRLATVTPSAPAVGHPSSGPEVIFDSENCWMDFHEEDQFVLACAIFATCFHPERFM
ncbi:hypothetical protein C8J57DRAFT_1359227 [Mycena rebaudengoi]|nr:hypothetical protein C8J57DRAFT_1359227 [Mycena rebaudengoi]